MWRSRQNIAAKYTEALRDLDTIKLHSIKSDRESSWHLFPIRLHLDRLTRNRAQIINELRQKNIGVGVHFMPVHQHLYYSESFNLSDKDYPVASSVFPRLLSLPIYPGMTDENVDKVIDIVIDTLNKFKK